MNSYLLSLPERLIRSALGLGAGVTRELGQIVLPEGIRRSQLYQNLVEATLRFLIEHARRHLRPYVRAAVNQFSPKRRTLSQRLLEKLGFVMRACWM